MHRAISIWYQNGGYTHGSRLSRAVRCVKPVYCGRERLKRLANGDPERALWAGDGGRKPRGHGNDCRRMAHGQLDPRFQTPRPGNLRKSVNSEDRHRHQPIHLRLAASPHPGEFCPGRSNVQMPANARFTLRQCGLPQIPSGGQLSVRLHPRLDDRQQRRVIQRQWDGGLGNYCKAFGHNSIQNQIHDNTTHRPIS